MRGHGRGHGSSASDLAEELGVLAGQAEVNSKEEWIPAAEALRLLTPGTFKSGFQARETICKRANKGLIRARAERFIIAGRVREVPGVPPLLWWAEGAPALNQNWITGDFDTW